MKHIFDTLKEFILILQDIIKAKKNSACPIKEKTFFPKGYQNNGHFILMQYYLHQLNDQLLQLHRIFQA